MLISKNHLKARFTASKDTTRPVLTAIQITKVKGEVIAAATNGYVLSEIREKTPSDDEFPNGVSNGLDELKVQAETAASLAKAMKGSRHLPILSYAHVGVDAITTTDLEHTQKFKDHPIEGNFPDYAKLIPTTSEAKEIVMINPEYFATMAKLFKGEYSVTMEVHGKDKPVVFRSSQDDHSILGIIMPLRG